MTKNRRDLNREATHAAILSAARKLFARKGYAGTPLSAIVRAARVTTGAVYHQFKDKRGLFQAVAESVELEILKRVGDRAAGLQDPWLRLAAGAAAMLEICTEPAIRRIVFEDAPNVIGAAKWREIELRYGYGAMRATLLELQSTGELRAGPVDVLAPMILGALIEAANAIACAEQEAEALVAAQETISLFLEALRTKAGTAPRRAAG